MTYQEKKKKAVAIAVAYFIEQEKAALNEQNASRKPWGGMGKSVIMANREVVQRRGRLIR